ncbi:MAG: hypothetical protein [Microviridae sp.]|nr:MAG: hypothetical protein [Microviridae sp.]
MDEEEVLEVGRAAEALVVGLLTVAAIVLGVAVTALVHVLHDPAKSDTGCNHEKIETHTKPLSDAHLRHGRVNTYSVRTRSSGRYNARLLICDDQSQSVEHSCNAPGHGSHTSLVRSQSFVMEGR